jgi:hypothetical protein
VNMPPNTAWMQFQIQAGQVTSTTPVTLTATLNSGQATVQFNVNPPSLKAITLTPASISGGAQGGAIAMLNGQAPAGGAVVDFSSDSPSAMPPALATIPAGSSSVSVSIPTNQVSANTLANISATWNGASVQSPLTITPQGQPASISLSPASVSGISSTFATVTMAAPSATDQILQISSSNAAASLTANSVTIPAGSTTGGFFINTASVSNFDAEPCGCANKHVTGRNCGRPQRRASCLEPNRSERCNRQHRIGAARSRNGSNA